MAFAYHGKYCGPGWSAGKYQNSVQSDVLHIDTFDGSCRTHDAQYAAPGADLFRADMEFAGTNITSGNPKAMIAGLAVGAQGLLRGVGLLARDNSSTKPLSSQKPEKSISSVNQMTKKSRIVPGIARKGKLGEIYTRTTAVEEPGSKARLLKRQAVNAFSPVRVTAAPVAIGNTVVASRSRVTQRNNGVNVSGRDVLTTVRQTASSAWQLGALLPVHPAYYNGTTLANYCRAYTQYRFTRLKFSYITKQPTSTTGQVILSHRRNAVEPAEDGNAAIFIPRVMSRKNSTMGPIWGNLSVDVDCDSEFRLVDAFITDWQDNVLGDLEVYVQSDTATDAGYIMLEYQCEFHTPIVSPHLSMLPLPVGANTPLTITVGASGVTVPGNGLDLTQAGIPFGSNQNRGSVWKVVLDADLSTFAANFQVGFTTPSITPGALTVTYANSVQSLTFVDGLTLWVSVQDLSRISLYATYDQAAACALGGVLVSATSTAWLAGTNLVGTAYLARFKPGEITASS